MIEKQAAGYYGPDLNRKDFACGGCMMGIAETSECTVVKPAKINLKTGGCNLYVPGENIKKRSEHPPMQIVPHANAGYSNEGPFTCGRCANFRPGNGKIGRCLYVAGEIHRKGCCNHWTKAGPPRTEEQIFAKMNEYEART